MPRRKKEYTPEEMETRRLAKAARERERYQTARKAGFSPDEARSLKKAVAKQPEIIQNANDAMIDLLAGVKGLAETAGKALENLLEPAPQPKKRRRTSEQPSGESGRTSTRSTASRTAARPDFEQFVRDNPGLSARELMRQFREQGGTIGTSRGKELTRNVREQEKKYSKITRIKIRDEKEIKNKFNKKYHRKTKKYTYLASYTTEENPDKRRYITIRTDKQLTMSQLRDEVIDAYGDGVADDEYSAEIVIPTSINVEYAVQTG